MKLIRCAYILLLLLCAGAVTSCVYDPDVSPFTLGEIISIPRPDGTDGFASYFPDGKICAVQRGTIWQLFWGERNDFRTEHESVWPENHYSQITSDHKVYGEGFDKVKDYSDNGAWFIGVYPLDDKGSYVGFYHGESWYNAEGVAYKSIGVTYSSDYGKTWHDSQPIIVDEKTKAQSSGWSGLGDGCVIRDTKNNRWICFYQAEVKGFLSSSRKICAAVSYDPEGKSGTWRKWNGSGFSGNKNVAIKNLDKIPGANPSVMWNDYLNRYVMVFHSWEHRIYISFSNDGLRWSSPHYIANGVYPNLFSNQGDTLGGQDCRIYFAPKLKSDGTRDLSYFTIQFR